MLYIFLVSFGFLLPSIAAKSIRAKVIYFINAVIVSWVIIDASNPFFTQIYNNGMSKISSTQAFSLLILSSLSIFYYLAGFVKLYKRREDFKNIFTRQHNFSFKENFLGEFDLEEMKALYGSFIGILIITFSIILFILKAK